MTDLAPRSPFERPPGAVPLSAYAVEPRARSCVDWQLYDDAGEPRGERIRYSLWRRSIVTFLERYGNGQYNRDHFRMCMSQYMTIAGEHARFGGWRPECR